MCTTLNKCDHDQLPEEEQFSEFFNYFVEQWLENL